MSDLPESLGRTWSQLPAFIAIGGAVIPPEINKQPNPALRIASARLGDFTGIGQTIDQAIFDCLRQAGIGGGGGVAADKTGGTSTRGGGGGGQSTGAVELYIIRDPKQGRHA